MVQAAAKAAIDEGGIVTTKDGRSLDLKCFFTDPAMRPATCPPPSPQTQATPAKDDEWHSTPGGLRWRIAPDYDDGSIQRETSSPK
jgi:hypothetical protein